MSTEQAVCPVCENPRSTSLTPGQIRWHNHDHPTPSPRRSGKVGSHRSSNPVMVVLRPGDRLIYEVAPHRYEELDVAGLLARNPSSSVVEVCNRCQRRVVASAPVDRSLVGRLRRLLPFNS
jgi:hypothetical protein